MRTIYVALLLCIILLVLASCGGGNTPAPTATATRTAAATAIPRASTTPAPTLAPLLPKGTKVPATMGAFFTYKGVTYTIDPGKEYRIWGVVGKVSVAQAESTPIGAGKKILLIAPAHSY